MGDRPKRPLSSYMLWLNENRESIKKANPGCKVTEIAKRGGELWREIKDKTVSRRIFYLLLYIFFFKEIFMLHKIVYHQPVHFFFPFQEWEQKAVDAKERYTRSIKEFEANGGSKDSGASTKKRGSGGRGAKKAPIKKTKTKAESEDEESAEEESD